MQLGRSFVGVTHPQNVVLLALQPGEGHGLEVGHHLALLVIARRVVALEGDDARCVPPLVLAGVDQHPGALGISRQHLGRGISRHGLAGDAAARLRVEGGHHLGGRVLDRPPP